MQRFLLLPWAGVFLVTGALAAPPPTGMVKPATKPISKSAAAPNLALFTEAATTWADIQSQVKDLDLLVKEKRLDEVHPVAFEIRDLVRTLPDKSQGLAAADQKRLEAQVRIVDRLAEQLDRYGDAGNAAGTVRQQQALLRTLGTIQNLYPKGSLKIQSAETGGSSQQRELYLTPGGAYTAADIQANGNQLPAQKFRGVKVNHDLKPAVGDRICPITLTKANPGYTWIVGGKEYQFCCPPCVEEFVTKAKKDPGSIKPPEEFVKKAA